MSTATLTKRERLIKLSTELETRWAAAKAATDASGQPPAAAEREAITKMAEDCLALKDEIIADQRIESAAAGSKSFLAELGGEIDDEQAPGTKSEGGLHIPTQRQVKTFGQQYVESEEYQQVLKSRRPSGDVSFKGQTEKWNLDPEQGVGRKDLLFNTTAIANGGGALIQPDRRPGVIDRAPFTPLTVADRVTRLQTNAEIVEYIRVLNRNNRARIVPQATSLTPGVTSKKPLSDLGLEIKQAAVVTIANAAAMTRRAAANGGQVVGMVNKLLTDGIDQAEEEEIVNGDGTPGHFEGLRAAGILTQDATGMTDIDAVLAAVGQILLHGITPTDVFIHPADWMSDGFVASKDSTGRYLLVNPASSPVNATGIWGLNPLVSVRAPQGAPIVGYFPAAEVYEAESVQVYTTDSHADWFLYNILAILAEKSEAFAVTDSNAFCQVTFDTGA